MELGARSKGKRREKGNGEKRTIIKPIKHVQKHRPHVPTAVEIDLDVRFLRNLLARVVLLKGPAAAPDDHRESEEEDEDDLGLERAPQRRQVEEVADEEGADDLAQPVQHVVERARADVELGQVEVLEVVGVEDVGAEEL